MINYKKLTLFVVTTIMFILALTFKTTNYCVVIPMYIVFILVGLYDLGVDEYENEKIK